MVVAAIQQGAIFTLLDDLDPLIIGEEDQHPRTHETLQHHILVTDPGDPGDLVTLTWYLSLVRARISPVFHTARVLALTRLPSTRGPLSTWQHTSLHGAQVGQESDGASEELSSLEHQVRNSNNLSLTPT